MRSVALPSRSDIENWTTAHLDDAVTRWNQAAIQAEDAFDRHRQNIAVPGGTGWFGDAKDAALAKVNADQRVVSRQAGVQREAAGIAARGASDIRAARQAAINAITEAEADGFSVADDLSVKDRRYGSPLIATPVGRLQAAVLHAEDIRWNAEQLAQTDARVGQQLRAKAAELSGIRFGGEGDGGDDPVQLMDFDVAEAPPPAPPYPMYDVIAEATDLDGNHVVLRRGYYDAATKKGFGWDKAYWKHGVVNPNVFTDLISHSRPVSNENGTLVYDVPINRAHCTPGIFGTADCQDTGESVTMRIVVNSNEGNPVVPDGGQKGVITMYPLAGGSGVVEVEPGWTLTPPWVNNNVPIN